MSGMWINGHYVLGSTIEGRLTALSTEVERLRARLAEAERDAARYRWLRTERDMGFWKCHEKDGEGGQILRYGVDLDEAIDSAMATDGGEGAMMRSECGHRFHDPDCPACIPPPADAAGDS